MTKRIKPEDQAYNKQEVAAFLNNAAVAAARQMGFPEPTGPRLAKVQVYTKELLKVLQGDVDSGMLTQAELTMVLVSAGLLCHFRQEVA